MTHQSLAFPTDQNSFPAAVRAMTEIPGSHSAGISASASLALLLGRAAGTLNFDPHETRSTLSRALALLDAAHSGVKASTAAGALAPWQANKVAAFIESHLETGVQIAELAAVTRLSRSYFGRAFKATFGRSPMQYLIERRVAQAKVIMLSTDKALCEVALDCGFADQAHLSRLFHRSVGQSPSVWRRARRHDPDFELPTIQ